MISPPTMLTWSGQSRGPRTSLPPGSTTPWAEELGEALSSHGIAWYLSGVQYEEDTGFFHYEWVWEVTD